MTETEFPYFAGALMEHFQSSPLGKYTNVLTEQFFQGNVLLRHLLNEENMFKSAFKNVNDWPLNFTFFRNF